MDLGASAFFFGPQDLVCAYFCYAVGPYTSYMIGRHALHEFCTWVWVILSLLILVSL